MKDLLPCPSLLCRKERFVQLRRKVHWHEYEHPVKVQRWKTFCLNPLPGDMYQSNVKTETENKSVANRKAWWACRWNDISFSNGTTKKKKMMRFSTEAFLSSTVRKRRGILRRLSFLSRLHSGEMNLFKDSLRNVIFVRTTHRVDDLQSREILFLPEEEIRCRIMIRLTLMFTRCSTGFGVRRRRIELNLMKEWTTFIALLNEIDFQRLGSLVIDVEITLRNIHRRVRRFHRG